MIDNKQVIEALKKEVESNSAAAAMFHVFALRERTTFTISLSSLMLAMKTEGFIFAREDYAKVLKLMGELGLGKIVTGPSGRIKKLTEIKVKLQSLGQAVVGKGEENLKTFSRRHKFEEVKKVNGIRQNTIENLSNKLKLTMYVNDKPISLDLPNGLTREEMVSVITYMSKLK